MFTYRKTISEMIEERRRDALTTFRLLASIMRLDPNNHPIVMRDIERATEESLKNLERRAAANETRENYLRQLAASNIDTNAFLRRLDSTTDLQLISNEVPHEKE
jgi:hypothetical protein